MPSQIRRSLVGCTAIALATLTLPVLSDVHPTVRDDPGASSQALPQHYDSFQLVGKARFSVMFWDIFDSELAAPDGRFMPDQPYALTLTYLRDLSAREIVDTSISEISRQSDYRQNRLEDWRRTLERIMPTVRKGDSLTGVHDGEGAARFYYNGAPIGKLDDAQLTKAFFDIWLGEQTSSPRLRRQLLGLSRS